MEARLPMIRIAGTISVCLLAAIGTSMLLGCSGDDDGTESVKQMGSAGQGGAKAPFYGLAGAASSAGAASYAGRGGAGGASGAGASGAGASGVAAAAGLPNFIGAPEGGRDSFGFGGGAGTVLRIDSSAGSGGIGVDRDADRGEDDGSWWSIGGVGGTRIWASP